MEENGYEKPHFLVWNRVGIWDSEQHTHQKFPGVPPPPPFPRKQVTKRRIFKILGSLFLYYMYFSIWPSCLAQEKLMDAYGEEKTQTRAEPDSNL